MNDNLKSPTTPAASSTLLDDVLTCAESLQNLLDSACPQTAIERGDADLVADFVNEAADHLDAAEQELLRTDEADVDTVFRAFHTIKGAAGFLQLHPILALAHATETLLDHFRQGRYALAGAAVELVLGSVDLMRALILDVRTTLEGQPTPPRPGVMQQVRRCNAFVPTTITHEESKLERRAADRRSPGDGTLRVNAAQLDALSDLVAKLAEHDQHPSEPLSSLIAAIEAQCATLRTVRFDSMLQRLQRVTHDTARKVGKQVELSVVGGAALLDRRVADALIDPLVQMVRNAIDHGIESPDQRVAAWKPPVGTVELDLYRHGSSVCLEIRDDGNGLDVPRLKNNAVQRGHITQSQADALSDRSAYELIFTPGLTTATDVTQISGRGVGMDVVRRNVQVLGGQITVRSQAGGGAVFTIRLDTTPKV